MSKPRGFAAMSPEKAKEIRRQGGKARSKDFTSEYQSKAAKKLWEGRKNDYQSPKV